MESILLKQREKSLPIDATISQRIIVRRKHLWEDALYRFRAGIDFNKHLRILFIGKPGVDHGGPLKEFLHILMGEIATNNSIFNGLEDCRVPAPNMAALQHNTYKHVGQMMAVSLIHGGPAPTFLAPSVVDYFVRGIKYVKASPEEVPIPTVKQKLIEVRRILVVHL